MRSNQLVLIETKSTTDFRIDEHTRDLGRQGVAAARRALEAATAQKKAA